ncbi:prolyl oligopeptidase family serine peptidase [bacterium]|nr:prolyl oligopeptidase family serine peptidase [bacterium]
MKFLFTRILLYVGLVAGVGAAQAEWRLESHFSALLAKEKAFYIYLPDSTNSGKTYPVLYLLHGVGGDYGDWLEASHVREQAQQHEMIIVLPDGGGFGWYLDSPVDSTSLYASYLVAELIPLIESRFPVASGPAARAISGLSMGGHGAVALALQHPDLFGAASSLSGILDLTLHGGMGDAWQLNSILGAYQQFPEHWRLNSCCDLVLASAARPALFIDCGLDDAFALVDNRKFNRLLDSLNIPHRYEENPGAHNWTYWDERLGAHLQFFAAFFSTARIARTRTAESFRLPACYPNPFNQAVTLVWSTETAARVSIEIYDSAGRLVRRLLNEADCRGQGQVVWDGAAAHGPAASGVYYIRWLTDHQARIMPVTLIR